MVAKEARGEMKRLLRLHEDLIAFGSKVQGISNQRFEGSKHIGPLFFDFGMKIGWYVIVLHRAIRELCDSGWTPTTPLLLRAMLESSVNYLTVIDNRKSSFMAFKYFAHDYFTPLLDSQSKDTTKTKALSDIRHCISLIAVKEERREAECFVEELRKKGKPYTYWFQPRPNSLSECIDNVADSETKEGLRFVYKALSMSVHATHIGMVMFKDDPGNLYINPTMDPDRTTDALLISCKLLLEFLNCRCNFEKLDLTEECSRLYDRGEKLYRAMRAAIVG
jgi:hypothetical protein